MFVVGTFRIIGKHTVASTVDAALAAGYRLIGMLKFAYVYFWLGVVTRATLC